MTAQKKRVIAVMSASIIMAAIRTGIFSFYMEKNNIETNAYYLPDNFAVIGFAVLTAVFLAVFAVSALLFGRKKAFVLENSRASVQVGSLILAFALIGETVIYAYSIAVGEGKIRSIGLLIIILSVLCAVSFFMNVRFSFSKKSPEKTLAILAILPIMLTAFRLLGDFIRTNTMPLASSGAYHLLGLTAALLYFLCEGKSHAARVSTATYYFFGFSSVFLLMVYAAPNIVSFCFGNFVFNYYAGFSIVDIATAIYICCRLSNAAVIKEKAPAEA